MAGYLDLAGFKAITSLPDSYIDAVELEYPGWIVNQLDYWSRWIDGLLAKRYAAPFATPYPTLVLNWLERIVTSRVMYKRGIDATDRQSGDILEDGRTAQEEVKAAANPTSALVELPLTQGSGTTGISKGAPLSYSEGSPYTWTRIQVEDLPE